MSGGRETETPSGTSCPLSYPDKFYAARKYMALEEGRSLSEETKLPLCVPRSRRCFALVARSQARSLTLVLFAFTL